MKQNGPKIEPFGTPCLMAFFGEPVTLTWTSCWRPDNLHFNTQKYNNLSAPSKYMGYIYILTNILTSDQCDFEITNLFHTKIYYTVVNKYCIFNQTQAYLFFW